jgi:hypothetical protein
MGADRKNDIRLAEARDGERFDEWGANVVSSAGYRYLD